LQYLFFIGADGKNQNFLSREAALDTGDTFFSGTAGHKIVCDNHIRPEQAGLFQGFQPSLATSASHVRFARDHLFERVPYKEAVICYKDFDFGLRHENLTLR
jgi:hypothetical protein